MKSHPTRVSSKQSKYFFGSNRNKPKLDLFWLIFGLFRATNKTLFQFVSVFRICFETTETNSSVSKQTEKIKKINKCHDIIIGEYSPVTITLIDSICEYFLLNIYHVCYFNLKSDAIKFYHFVFLNSWVQSSVHVRVVHVRYHPIEIV
jgi:hypothetical protein